jgi:hypothetical protein
MKRVTRIPFAVALSEVVPQYVAGNACKNKIRSALRVFKVIILDEVAPRTSLMS